MPSSITHAKINIMCFQGDEGPIGPSGLTGLEVSNIKCSWSGGQTGGGGLVHV